MVSFMNLLGVGDHPVMAVEENLSGKVGQPGASYDVDMIPDFAKLL